MGLLVLHHGQVVFQPLYLSSRQRCFLTTLVRIPPYVLIWSFRLQVKFVFYFN